MVIERIAFSESYISILCTLDICIKWTDGSYLLYSLCKLSVNRSKGYPTTAALWNCQHPLNLQLVARFSQMYHLGPISNP